MTSSHSCCEAWERRDLRVCLPVVLRNAVVLIWSYIDFGDILLRNGIFGIIAGSNHLLLRCYGMVLGGLTISHLALRVPTVLDFSPFYLASFAVALPSSSAVRKIERLCAEGLRLLFYHQQCPLHSSLHLLLPLLHARFVQQPFYLSAKHPHHVTLGTDGIWVGLVPSRRGTPGPHHLLERVQVHLRLTHEELLGGIPVFPEKGALVEFRDRLCQGPREREVDVPVPSKQVARHIVGRYMLLLVLVYGGLDGGGVGHGRVGADVATGP